MITASFIGHLQEYVIPFHNFNQTFPAYPTPANLTWYQLVSFNTAEIMLSSNKTPQVEKTHTHTHDTCIVYLENITRSHKNQAMISICLCTQVAPRTQGGIDLFGLFQPPLSFRSCSFASFVLGPIFKQSGPKTEPPLHWLMIDFFPCQHGLFGGICSDISFIILCYLDLLKRHPKKCQTIFP